MEVIRDVILIKSVERRLGRALTAEEMEQVDLGEPLRIRFRDGHYETVQIPLLKFPYDLLSSPEMYQQEEDLLSAA